MLLTSLESSAIEEGLLPVLPALASHHRVVVASVSDPALAAMHIRGEGHTFWVDLEAGYTADEQQALIDFLLSLRHDPAASPPRKP